MGACDQLRMAHWVNGADYGFVVNVAREYASSANYANPPDRELGPVYPWADFASRVIGGLSLRNDYY